jgi:beta-glucanase (GH16 family)
MVEEFDSPIDLDRDPIWTWSDGGLIEGQVRFIRDAIKFSDGKMKIEVGRGTNHESCSNAETVVISQKNLTSGEMRTRHNMFRYGRYEVSMKAPLVQPGNKVVDGNYVATMFVFRASKIKHWREIDIEVTGEGVDTMHTNVLSADHTAEWRADIGEEASHKVHVNLRSHFHTFAFEWLPHRITWYFNGKVIREKRGGKVPIPDLSGKIMMNTWVFNYLAMFGGKKLKNDHFPMHTEYDWFRFYKWDGDAEYPCSGMSTQCLTSDDKFLSSNNPCDGIPQTGTVYGEAPCIAHCS